MITCVSSIFTASKAARKVSKNAPDAPVDAGDRLKMARVATDHIIDEHDSGANVRSTQTPLARGDVNWNFTVA